MSAKLCREWVVVNTRLRHKDGVTAVRHFENPDSAASLNAIPLVIAGWLRYLLGIDDQGQPMEVSPDPLLDSLQEKLRGIKVGDPNSANGRLDQLLCDEKLFGISLKAAGLDQKVLACFREMLAGPGAVRAALQNHVK